MKSVYILDIKIIQIFNNLQSGSANFVVLSRRIMLDKVSIYIVNPTNLCKRY
jgi:hypothetical protein